MPPKFGEFGPGEYQPSALAAVLQRHPTETEGVSLTDKNMILQGKQSLVTKLERVGQAAIFTDIYGESQPRADQFLRLTIDGFGHGLRHTHPDVDAANGLNIIHFPGFGEVIEAGSAYNLHTSLATQFPGARVVSVATDGIGTIGEKVKLGNAFDHGIRGMGEARAKIIKALFGSQPVLGTSCSMGTAEVQEMLEFDLQHGYELNFYPLLYDTAVVEPLKTLLLMGVAFPMTTMADVSLELSRTVFNGDMHQILELAKMVEQREGDGLPMLIEMVSLMGGIALELTGRVSKLYGGTTISGAFDTIKRTGKWSHVKKHFCPDLHIVTVPWHGHGMAMRGDKAGQKMRSVVDHYGIETKLLEAA